MIGIFVWNLGVLSYKLLPTIGTRPEVILWKFAIRWRHAELDMRLHLLWLQDPVYSCRLSDMVWAADEC
jgi:hypothetical protein